MIMVWPAIIAAAAAAYGTYAQQQQAKEGKEDNDEFKQSELRQRQYEFNQNQAFAREKLAAEMAQAAGGAAADGQWKKAQLIAQAYKNLIEATQTGRGREGDALRSLGTLAQSGMAGGAGKIA